MVDLSNYEGPWPEDLLDQLPNLSKIRLARVSSVEAAWLAELFSNCRALKVFKCQGLARSRAFLYHIAQFPNLQI